MIEAKKQEKAWSFSEKYEWKTCFWFEIDEKKKKKQTSSSDWYHLLGHHLVNTSIMIIEMRWEWEWDDYEKFEKMKCKSFLNVFK